jgi:hypothetical protein
MGRLRMESASHRGQKNAYFWLYLASQVPIPGADVKLKEAAANLTQKEIAKMQKQGSAGENMSLDDKKRSLKKH